MEHMIRACLIALRLAESAALDDSERGVVYYSGLLAWVGCHTDAYEQAKWLGDDLAVKRDAHYGYDLGKAGPTAAFILKNVGGAGVPLLQRARLGARFLGDGRRSLAALAENHYLATTSWRPVSAWVSRCAKASGKVTSAGTAKARMAFAAIRSR